MIMLSAEYLLYSHQRLPDVMGSTVEGNFVQGFLYQSGKFKIVDSKQKSFILHTKKLCHLKCEMPLPLEFARTLET